MGVTASTEATEGAAKCGRTRGSSMPADRAIPKTAAAAAPASQVERPTVGSRTILVAASLPGCAAAPGSSAVSRPAWLVALRTNGAAARPAGRCDRHRRKQVRGLQEHHGLIDDPWRDAAEPLGGADREGAIENPVDAAGKGLPVTDDVAQGRVRHHPLDRAVGELQAIVDVLADLVVGQRLDGGAVGHLVVGCPAAVAGQRLPKFVPPRQDDLQGRPVQRLQARHEAQKLQRARVHRRRVIDDQDMLAAVLAAVREGMEQALQVVIDQLAGALAEQLRDDLPRAQGGQARMIQPRDAHRPAPPLVREAGEGRVQHGGLADLSVAADRDERPALQHVENDTGERVAMAGRHEYVARVGRRGERITRELIEALVHPRSPYFV